MAEKGEGEEVKAPVTAARCEECSQPLDNGDHEDGECGFRRRLTQLVSQANGGVNVWA